MAYRVLLKLLKNKYKNTTIDSWLEASGSKSNLNFVSLTLMKSFSAKPEAGLLGMTICVETSMFCMCAIVMQLHLQSINFYRAQKNVTKILPTKTLVWDTNNLPISCRSTNHQSWVFHLPFVSKCGGSGKTCHPPIHLLALIPLRVAGGWSHVSIWGEGRVHPLHLWAI